MKFESRREMTNTPPDGDEDPKLSVKKPAPVTSEKEDEYLAKLKELDETHGGI